MALPSLLTPEQVAETLGSPLGTLYQWRYRHIGPPGHRVGRHVRYDPQDVAAWLQAHRDDWADDPRPAP